MASPKGFQFLSKRAQEQAIPSPRNLIWEVLADQWNSDTNPNGYVSLGVAENRLMHDVMEQHIAHLCKTAAVQPHAFTYGDGPFGSHRIRRAIARFLTRHLKPVDPINPSHVYVTNGVSHAIEHTSWGFCNPGDGMLLGKPYYGAFIPDINLRPGVEVVEVDFGRVDPMSPDAVQEYEKAVLAAKDRGVAVKALMLCSPHNPLGRCYSRTALLKYLQLCQKYQVHLISDEIYALSVWDNKEDSRPVQEPFTSVLSIPLQGLIEPSLVHILWGMSKDFGANGLRLGCIITHNAAFREAMKSVAIYSYVSSLSDHIVANILENNAWTDSYIKENQLRLSKSYSWCVEFLRQHEIPYTPGANAAFFLWMDLGAAYSRRHNVGDKDLTEEVMQALLKQKLYLASGAIFGSETPGIFRIVFSHPDDYLVEGLKRMAKAIEVGNVQEQCKAKL